VLEDGREADDDVVSEESGVAGRVGRVGGKLGVPLESAFHAVKILFRG